MVRRVFLYYYRMNIKYMKKIIDFLKKVGVLKMVKGGYDAADSFGSSANSQLREKKKGGRVFPLFFWIGFILLFLVSLLFAFGAGLLVVVVVVAIWALCVFAIFFFSFSLVLSILSVVIVFFVSLSYTIFFASDQPVRKVPLPVLEMTVVKSPQVINCDDEKSTLEIKAKNIGQKDLAFDEVKNHQYDFEICDGDKENKKGTRSCFPGMSGYINIADFGEIKKGETGTIALTTPTDTKPDNAIVSFLDKNNVNGTYKYYVSFVHIVSPKKKPLISKSNISTVKTNIMNATNDYIKEKCRRDYKQ